MVESIRILRGEQALTPLNVAIVGGGKACYNLLKIMDDDRLSRLRMKILGVSDLDPDAPGFCYANELKLFTSTDFHELFTLEGLSMIIELTGSTKVKEEIFRTKPSEVSVIDFRAARLLWDLIQMETEKTKLERERQEYQGKEKKHTQVILDSLPYRIMVVNTDMTIATVNQTFLKEFALPHDAVLGKFCYEARYGIDEPCDKIGNTCYLKNYLNKIEERKSFSTIKEHRDENGENRFDVITVAPIYNEQGEIVQILEASRDVTERIRLEREVQKSSIFFENVIKSTVDGIVVVDTKGSVLIFNEGMERLTGYSSDEIINQGHLSSFYDIGVAKENMIKMRSDQYGPLGKLNPTSMTITTKEGEEIPVTLTASIITIAGKEIGSVGVFTDMREILRMRKGRMAAGVAHEINNPLAGIMIYAELLKEGQGDNKQHLDDIQEIIDQTLRCKKIVSELLEFSRQSVGKVSSFNLVDMINKTLNILINQAIFQNIEVIKFINAADAMGGKGKLSISARYDTDTNQFDILVHDTGPGIPEELRGKIFDMFFTTKPVGKGTGLGLSICKRIVELHGGNLIVECPPDGGTTFIVELPLGFVEKPEEESLFIGLDE